MTIAVDLGRKATKQTKSTSVLKALPGKLEIKRHSPSIFYILASLGTSTSILYISESLAISKDTHLIFSIFQIDWVKLAKGTFRHINMDINETEPIIVVSPPYFKELKAVLDKYSKR